MGIINVQEQLEMFAGVVYLPETNRARMPDGALLDQKRFNVQFPGRFAMGHDTRFSAKAWHAFIHNQAYHCPVG